MLCDIFDHRRTGEFMDNLALWDSLKETNPKYTKPFDRGGFKGTAINGTYVAMRLTEAFGPCGTGWRFVIDEERTIPGPAVKTRAVRKEVIGKSADGDPITLDTETVTEVCEILHVIRGHIEYRLPNPTVKGEWLPDWHATSPQFGQTKMVLHVARGKADERFVLDEEAPKKSVTDCVAKCAVLLGVASDVHMGLYDDNKYVNEVKDKFAPKMSSAQVSALNDALAAAGLKVSTFCKKYAIKTVADLPTEHYDAAMRDVADYGAARKAKEAAKEAGDGRDPAGQDAK